MRGDVEACPPSNCQTERSFATEQPLLLLEAETGFAFHQEPQNSGSSAGYSMLSEPKVCAPPCTTAGISLKNLDFLTFHFRSVMPPGPKREAMAEAAADSMRTACREFGVTAETAGVVELYQELLLKLDAHFAEHPYLLGAKPCVGDFGLIAPFYGHLGRDPKPLSLMQARAIRLFRWVERMNRPGPTLVNSKTSLPNMCRRRWTPNRPH